MNRRDMLAFGAAAFFPFRAAEGATAGHVPAANQMFDVRQYGARGDGKTKDTAAIQRAIDAAFTSGGGTVFLGPGEYLSGGLTLKSNITLYLHAGATLLGSKNLADYAPHPGPDPHGDANVHHLIFARGAENIALCGLGCINGQGRAFWTRKGGDPQIPAEYWREAISNSWHSLPGDARPSPMLEFVQCHNLRIEGLTISNSAGWTMRPIECESVFIHNIRVRNPIYGPNTDGMDITCCRNVFIANCDIATGDDALCLKSQHPYLNKPGPTANITITNCVLTGCCNGFKIGTATMGAFENITFTNSVIYNRDDSPLNARILAGIAVEMVDGGSVEGIVISNIRMQNARTPIFIRLGDRSGNPPSGPKPGALRGVMIDNIYATGAISTSLMTGLPGHDIEDITLSNIRIDTVEGGQAAWVTRKVPELAAAYPEAKKFGRLPAYGFYCRHTKGLRFNNVRVNVRKPDMRPLLVCDDVQDLNVADLAGDAPADGEPLLLFRDVRRAFVHGCCAPPHLVAFLGVEGGQSSDISIIGNDLRAVMTPVQTGDGAARSAISEEGNSLRKS